LTLPFTNLKGRIATVRELSVEGETFQGANGVDLELVWGTIRTDLPELKTKSLEF